MSCRKDVRLLNVYRSCQCSYKKYWQRVSFQISYRRKTHIAVSKENILDSPAKFVLFTVNFTAIALLSTYFSSYLWHVSYPDTQFDIPCWQNIMTCFTNHDATSVSISRLSLNLKQPKSASNLKTWKSFGAISGQYSMSSKNSLKKNCKYCKVWPRVIMQVQTSRTEWSSRNNRS